MSGIEKEYRFQVDDTIIQNIRKIAKVVDNEQEQIDLTLGYAGFESLYKYGYVCRVRQKGNHIWMEIKNKKDDLTFYENKIIINNFLDGVKFFKSIGMKPYMYMKRTREILEYDKLKIFIDNIELLGKFVEVEFQDVDNYEEVLTNFLRLVQIDSESQPLYGDIIINRMKENENFRKEYERKLEEFTNNIQ